jgi:hypothetical protein
MTSLQAPTHQMVAYFRSFFSLFSTRTTLTPFHIGRICEQGCRKLRVWRPYLDHPHLTIYIPSLRTAIALRVKDGVVLAVEKLVHSKLLVPGANRRIQTIDRHIGLVRLRAILI